jgi:hypothetical protein
LRFKLNEKFDELHGWGSLVAAEKIEAMVIHGKLFYVVFKVPVGE